jgi:hypothetical protein
MSLASTKALQHEHEHEVLMLKSRQRQERRAEANQERASDSVGNRNAVFTLIGR